MPSSRPILGQERGAGGTPGTPGGGIGKGDSGPGLDGPLTGALARAPVKTPTVVNAAPGSPTGAPPTGTLPIGAPPPRTNDGDWLAGASSRDGALAALHVLTLEEVALDAALDEALRTPLEGPLALLTGLGPGVASLVSSSGNLEAILRKTSALAERISAQVRRLDLEQGNVRAAMGLCESIQDLRACAADVSAALDAADTRAACAGIRRYLEFDPAVVAKIFPAGSLPSEGDGPGGGPGAGTLGAGDNPLAVLARARDTLLERVAAEFARAAAARAEEDLIAAFKLFPQLGHQDRGLALYADYLAAAIRTQAQNNAGARAETPTHYADLLTLLFEAVATIVDRQSAFIQELYGPGRLLLLLVHLKAQVELQAGIILQGLLDARGLARKLHELDALGASGGRPRDAPGAGPDALGGALDLRDLDVLLTELALVSQRRVMFLRFIQVRAQDELGKLANQPYKEALLQAIQETHAISVETGLPPKSELESAVVDLVKAYERLETWYCRRSVEKAISLDSFASNGTDLISSSPEDVFYILSSTLKRALSTWDQSALIRIIGSSSRVILEYVEILGRKLTERMTATNVASAGGLVILLNNLDTTRFYLFKLLEDLEPYITRTFSWLPELDMMRLQKELGRLGEVGEGVRGVVKKTWLDNYFQSVHKARLKALFGEGFRASKYVLSEAEYAAAAATEILSGVGMGGGPGVRRVMAKFDAVMAAGAPGAAWRDALTETNHNELLVKVVDLFVHEWERWVWAEAKFSQLGAIRFDKDLRAFMSFLSSQTPWSVRDKFARLTQISTLVNLESVAEVQEIWGTRAGGMVWKLSLAELKRVLEQRVDFEPREIAKLVT